MAYRKLELTLISANDLRDVYVFSRMNVYALVTIAGVSRAPQRTPVDREGGKNPLWNSTFRFIVPADPAACRNLVIHVLLRSERALGVGDVGEVHIPLKELLDGGNEGSQFVSYQVRKPGSGMAKGVLNLSYNFVDLPASSTILPPVAPVAKPAQAVIVYLPSASEKPPKENMPVMVYPAPSASGSTYPLSYPPMGGYPPYQPQGGYVTYPSQGSYGYGAPP